jgi:hypothetical protein
LITDCIVWKRHGNESDRVIEVCITIPRTMFPEIAPNPPSEKNLGNQIDYKSFFGAIFMETLVLGAIFNETTNCSREYLE